MKERLKKIQGELLDCQFQIDNWIEGMPKPDISANLRRIHELTREPAGGWVTANDEPQVPPTGPPQAP